MASIGENDLAPRPVDPDRRLRDDIRPATGREGREIDMHGLARIETGDMSRQHAGIGGFEAVAHEGQPGEGLGLARKGPEHLDMAVPSADQNDAMLSHQAARPSWRALPVSPRPDGSWCLPGSREPLLQRNGDQ